MKKKENPLFPADKNEVEKVSTLFKISTKVPAIYMRK